MRFLIITHVFHKTNAKQWYAYAPYVREMNLWLKYVDQVEIIAPMENAQISEIDIAYKHNNIKVTKIPSIAFINISRSIKSLLALPYIILKLWEACKRADHIHLRCPGNIGLLGCLVQILFPKKVKTAKYAGNWDPKSSQPLSYRIQKRILSNTFWTKNMTVLVYGAWINQTKNIKSFFTASYIDKERCQIETKNYSKTLGFVFVGSLVSGKRPLLAIQIIEALHHKGYAVTLDLYGDGVLKQELQTYIIKKTLQDCVVLHGNQSSVVVKQKLKTTHFVLLASKSEGWPKAIAEAMFFGVIPIATAISCVPNMLDYDARGILIEPNVTDAVSKIIKALSNPTKLKQQSKAALIWSQHYTLDLFEDEIGKLLKA